MKSSVVIEVVLIVIISILLINCSGAPIKFGGIPQFANSEYVDFTKGRSITASGVGFQLFGFIPISINDRHQRAYDELIKQAHNDYLTNIQINDSWVFAYYGVIYRTTIMATAYPRVKN
jgi:hypothetical protein